MKALLLILTLFSAPAIAAPKCVQIYYDVSPKENYWMGRTYAYMLQNLLGHFPEFQQIVSPIEEYQKGDLDKCAASIYIGSYFENAIPPAFLEDFRTTKRNVAWLGYSIWKLGNSELERIFGYRYLGLTQLDKKNLDEKSHPTFYKWIHYKGERFRKYGNWSATDPTIYVAPFEQVMLALAGTKKSEVLAESEHTFTGKKLPYAIRAENRFYVADVPFSYMHEADRYMIFADLLFDILQEKPRHKERLALIRLEDVHAYTPLYHLYRLSNLLFAKGIRPHYSLIPIFFDPLFVYNRSPQDEFMPMNLKPEFQLFLKEELARGARFIWHGVTHQLDRTRNPHDGATGADFEFWDGVNLRPLGKGPEWTLNRLWDGISVWRDAGLPPPQLWLTPHYQAAPEDYYIFARVFPWNVGRVIYFNNRVTGLPEQDKGVSPIWIKDAGKKAAELRSDHFAHMQVTRSSEQWSGQIFPYEIYGDIHGQRLLPENLGNSQPFKNRHVVQPRSVEEMIEDARRNLVLRDVWASFFYHPFLLESLDGGGRGEYPGDSAELDRLVTSIQKLGYRFVDAEEFIRGRNELRPEPQYRGNVK